MQDYLTFADDLTTGFVEAEKILQEERIFVSRDLPYTTQLIPLAALCTVLQARNQIKVTNVKNKIKQWYWCGVFGELYGSANETRYANDIVQVLDWVAGSPDLPKTCQESYFNPLRLLSMQSRQSAAYKGIMALILKNHGQDFISGRDMDFTVYMLISITFSPKIIVKVKNYQSKSGIALSTRLPFLIVRTEQLAVLPRPNICQK